MKPAFVLTIIIAMFFATVARAQEAAVPQEKGSIAGTVIDGVTEEPLKGADVGLRRLPGGSAAGSQSAGEVVTQSASASTDASGRFAFDGLSSGRYIILASHDGYASNNRAYADLRGRLFSLAPGQHVGDIVVRLLPNGTIAGRVTDEAGKPMRGVSMQAMKSSYPHGRRELHEAAHAVTNDDGEYRIAGLVSGKYYIRAKPPESSKAAPKKDQNKSKEGDKAYVPIYYPAANDWLHSVVLVVRAGEDLAGIDMNLAPVHTVRIRGRVIDGRTSLPSGEAEVTLLGDQGETVFAPGANFSVAGQANFEFEGVPPGSYVVVAQQPSTPREPKAMWGRTSIEVKDVSLDHVDVLVGAGVDVRGHIRIEGDQNPDLSKDLSTMAGTLEPLEPSALANLTPDIDNAIVKLDGTFLFPEVPEGIYRPNFFPLPAGFYLRSSGAADVLENGITVNQGRSPAPFELVLIPGAGRIDGTAESDGQSAPGASVVLVPDGKGRGQPNSYRQSSTDLLGRFVMRNIIPGDYTLFAWEQVERGAYFDPDFLGQYEDRGKPVHVDEGGRVNVKLEVIPAAESVP